MMDRLRWATKIRPEARTENKFVGKEGEREREREREREMISLNNLVREECARGRACVCARTENQESIVWGRGERGLGYSPGATSKGVTEGEEV